MFRFYTFNQVSLLRSIEKIKYVQDHMSFFLYAFDRFGNSLGVRKNYTIVLIKVKKHVNWKWCVYEIINFIMLTHGRFKILRNEKERRRVYNQLI